MVALVRTAGRRGVRYGASVNDPTPAAPTARPAYVHRGGNTPLLGLTLDAHFREVVRRHGEREAVVSLAQGTRMTYTALDAAVQSTARALLALGVQAGDRVALWSTDNAEWVVVQMAAARVGALLVNLNPAWRADEVAYALERARVQVLVTIPAYKSSKYVELVRELCPTIGVREPDELNSACFPALRTVVLVDPAEPLGTRRPAPGFLLWREFLARGRGVPDEDVATRGAALDPDDPVNVQFTSGTTGFPKAVLLTHHNLLNNAWFAGRGMGFTAQDRLCVPVPFYHCFGMVLANLVCLSHGATIVIPAPHFEAGATLAAIQAERCTAVHGVPTMFVEELEHPRFAEYDLTSLRTGIMAGAPCPESLVRRVVEEMGCAELLVGYGQTEASPLTHLTERDDPLERRARTVGRNLPHQEVKLVDPATGALRARGEPGEVCFRGYHVMRGYYEQEDATRAAIDPAGWLHSGDLGVLDEDGRLAITGRLKDMIIRGGENLYPAEIEAVLDAHPAVAESAVFGVHDERMGEEVGAWVRLREGATTTADELKRHVRARLAHYKTPRYLELVPELPMTVTGKIQKFRMREDLERRLREHEVRAGAEVAS